MIAYGRDCFSHVSTSKSLVNGIVSTMLQHASVLWWIRVGCRCGWTQGRANLGIVHTNSNINIIQANSKFGLTKANSTFDLIHAKSHLCLTQTKSKLGFTLVNLKFDIARQTPGPVPSCQFDSDRGPNHNHVGELLGHTHLYINNNGREDVLSTS